MPDHKHFPPLPDFARDHPKALEWRVDRIEDHLETHHPLSSGELKGLLQYIPGLILWLCGLLGLVLPEAVANALRAMGH